MKELHNRVVMVTIHFHIAQMSLCLGTIFSHSGGGGGVGGGGGGGGGAGNFSGTNEKLSWGCKVGQIRFCCIGYPISVLI